ncbi:hypothetical protein AOLI_G00155660 [Acnodon oligacanthus]
MSVLRTVVICTAVTKKDHWTPTEASRQCNKHFMSEQGKKNELCLVFWYFTSDQSDSILASPHEKSDDYVLGGKREELREKLDKVQSVLQAQQLKMANEINDLSHSKSTLEKQLIKLIKIRTLCSRSRTLWSLSRGHTLSWLPESFHLVILQ